MTATLVNLRTSRLYRILVALLLLLALVGSAGVAVADDKNDKRVVCPDESPNQGDTNSGETAHDSSLDGRLEALEGSECITKK